MKYVHNTYLLKASKDIRSNFFLNSFYFSENEFPMEIEVTLYITSVPLNLTHR